MKKIKEFISINSVQIRSRS